MYEQFYGLREEPFRLSPDSRLCFRHKSYKKAKAYMQYALHRGEGFVMVTGQPGTGKTTLIKDLTSDLADGQIVFSDIVSTQLHGDDLLRLVALNFGLENADQSQPKALLLHSLEQRLKRLYYEGNTSLLIIDEAQDLSSCALEELRLLTNIHLNDQPLLQIFLVGQKELLDIVLSPKLEQLHQRIVAACHLDPLDEDKTEEYIKYRLNHVEWNSNPRLDQDIFPFIHKFSLGVPRWINMICSRMLLHGMVEDIHVIGANDIKAVLRGLLKEQLLPMQIMSGNPHLLQMIGINQNQAKANFISAEEKQAQKKAKAQISARESGVTPLSSHTQSKTGSNVLAPAVATMNHVESSPTSNQVTYQQTSSATDSLARDEIHHAQDTYQETTQVKTTTPKIHQTRVETAKELYIQLRPLLTGKTRKNRKSRKEMLNTFLQFINGLKIEEVVLNLPEEERDKVETMGFLTWMEINHGNLNTDDLNDELIELMGFVTWVKQVHQNLNNRVVEVLGLLYGFFQSDENYN